MLYFTSQKFSVTATALGLVAGISPFGSSPRGKKGRQAQTVRPLSRGTPLLFAVAVVALAYPSRLHL